MSGVRCIAVIVQNEGVDREIAQKRIGVKRGGSVRTFVYCADGVYQPHFVLLSRLEHRIVPYRIIERKILALILKPYGLVVHTEEIAGVDRTVLTRKLGEMKGAVFLCAGDHSGNVHLFGLIHLSVLCAVVAQGKGFGQAFHRRVKSDHLAVQRHLHEAAKRRWNTHFSHHIVAKVVTDEAAVADVVVQRHLVKPVIPLALIERTEIQHKRIAFPFAHNALYQRCVALCADADMVKCFAVNRHIAIVILLVERVVLQVIPRIRVHLYFHRVYRVGVKQPVFVFGRNTVVGRFVFIRRCRRMTRCDGN